MNPFVSRFTANQSAWVVPVSVICLILGFMIAMAWVTDQTRSSRFRATLGAAQRARVGSGDDDTQAKYVELTEEVKRLREEKTRLENAMKDSSSSSKVLNDSLQETKMFAGLTEVKGPGLLVTLRDSPKRSSTIMATDETLHDKDIVLIINELWNAGAEAISVNNHRIGPRSNVRCVGSVIQVDNIHISSPVYIRAIGDGETMMGALNIPQGIAEELRNVDPSMIQMEVVAEMQMPPLTGSTDFKRGKLPKGTSQ